MFSKKVTKIDEIFTVDLTLCSKCQIDGEDFVNFCGLVRHGRLYRDVHLLENTNFKRIKPFKNPLCNYSMLSLVHFARKKNTVQSGEAIYQVRNRACRATHNCAM